MAVFKNNLEKSIFATIAYFDIFDYPLTLIEIWKWLYQPVNQLTVDGLRFDLLEIQKTLEESNVLKSLVNSWRGFYFLNGRNNLVELRQERYNLAEKKFKKALRVAHFLKFIPGIKMIAVCNDLAWSNAPKESDIDIFIVTVKNKIWFVRFWAVWFLKFFGLRPSPRKTEDKICLSFLVDEENLNLEKISLDKSDIYLIYWIAQLVPIYDCGEVYAKFVKANEWIKKYLPNSFGSETSGRRTLASQAKRSEVKQLCFAESVACQGVRASHNDLVERFFRWLQMKIMPARLKKMANKDSRVIVSDSMLKFHINDRREEYKRRWKKRLEL